MLEGRKPGYAICEQKGEEVMIGLYWPALLETPG